MRSVRGPLLIVVTLCLVSGCALPNRQLGRTNDFGSRGNRSNSKAGQSEFEEKVTFKAPRGKTSADSRSADRTPADDAEATVGESRIASRTGLPEIATGHSSDFSDDFAGGRSATATQASGSRGQQVASRSPANPIELQGLEFDGDPSPDNTAVQQAAAKQPTGQSPNPQRKVGVKSDSATSNLPLWTDRPAPSQQLTTNRTPASSNGAEVAQTSHSASASASASNPSLPPLPWQVELEQLIARVEQQIAATDQPGSVVAPPEQLRRHAQLRLLYLMAQRQEDALTAIPGVQASQQEYWQQVIWAMSNSFDTAQFPDASDRAAQTVPPLSAALRQMREEAALTIKNMTFCRKISYFGNYDRFPRNEFTPGYEVLLYTEIENFVSSPTVDGEYRTSLKSLIEIADSQGKIVWTKGFPPTEDFCRNPRRDYFHNYQFHIPEDLSTGAYTLKLTISDELSRKRATNSLNFVLK